MPLNDQVSTLKEYSRSEVAVALKIQAHFQRRVNTDLTVPSVPANFKSYHPYHQRIYNILREQEIEFGKNILQRVFSSYKSKDFEALKQYHVLFIEALNIIQTDFPALERTKHDSDSTYALQSTLINSILLGHLRALNHKCPWHLSVTRLITDDMYLFSSNQLPLQETSLRSGMYFVKTDEARLIAAQDYGLVVLNQLKALQSAETQCAKRVEAVNTMAKGVQLDADIEKLRVVETDAERLARELAALESQKAQLNERRRRNPKGVPSAMGVFSGDDGVAASQEASISLTHQ